MKEHAGKIDVELAKRFEADHFDTWRGKIWPGGRTLCGHFELDAEAAGNGGQAGERVRSSPLVRRMARENSIDLTRVPGSGLGVRISKQDIEASIALTAAFIEEGHRREYWPS